MTDSRPVFTVEDAVDELDVDPETAREVLDEMVEDGVFEKVGEDEYAGRSTLALARGYARYRSRMMGENMKDRMTRLFQAGDE